MTNSGHDRVGLVRKNAFLGTGAQEAYRGKECYD